MSLLTAVLRRRQPLDDALARGPAAQQMARLAARDRAFARAIAATALRRKGQIDAILSHFLDRGLPPRAGALPEILAAAVCQLLYLETPAHAVVGLAVRQCQLDRAARRYDKLANAVLRRVASDGPALAGAQDAARLNTPDWLWTRWAGTYGETSARAIAEAHLVEAPLDLSVISDPDAWSRRLGGVVLATGTVRVGVRGPIDALVGFKEGRWWVQDAAAALPVRLLGEVRGARVADLCAAPGGKTAQLASAGARVTSVDIAPSRLARVRENLGRLGLDAELIAADMLEWQPREPFDAVLLDAPCTATGTIRRHPDIPHLKREADVMALAALQARLLERATTFVRPGGRIVYCTCSLEPEEGRERIEALLAGHAGLARDPVHPEEVAGHAEWLTADGDLRTLPCHSPDSDSKGGMDGFFAARLKVAKFPAQTLASGST